MAETHGEKPIRPYTAKKEIKTLRHVLRWAVKLPHSVTPVGWEVDEVVMPPDPGKERFRTSKEILERIVRNNLDEAQAQWLWSSLYLTKPQLDECLTYVRANASEPWMDPIAAIAGARRSEIIRAEVDDFDLNNGFWDAPELKRDTDKEFTIRDSCRVSTTGASPTSTAASVLSPPARFRASTR